MCNVFANAQTGPRLASPRLTFALTTMSKIDHSQKPIDIRAGETSDKQIEKVSIDSVESGPMFPVA